MLTKPVLAALLATTAFSVMAGAQQPNRPATGPAPKGKPAADNHPERITVVGKTLTAGAGQMRAETGAQVVQTLSRAFISKQSPTASAVTLMATLPSVNISTPDAFGLQGGANVQMHGLSSNDIGWILDGLPVYNSGSSYANEIIDAEDLETLSVAPGTSNLGAPTTSSAAGTIYLSMRDPAKDTGGLFEVGLGSDAMNRQYIRLDSGTIGKSGIRGFVSFSHTEANNWRGAGSSDRKHIDFKILKDFEGGSRVAFEGSLNQQYYGYYYYPSAEQFANYRASRSDFNPNGSYGGVSDTSYYKLNQEDPFDVVALSLPSTLVLNDHLSIDDVPYVWIAYGVGTGGTDLTQGAAYQGSQLANVDLTAGGRIPLTDGQILVDSGFRVKTVQAGNTLKLTAHYGHNTAVAGWWYENYNQQETDPVGMVNQATGEPADIWDNSSLYKLSNGQTYYSNHSNQRYLLNTLFIGDTLSLFKDRLKLTAGFKDAMTSMWVTNLLPGANFRNGISSNEPLPQFTAHYQIDRHSQVFADAEADFRLPFTSSILSTYNISSGALSSTYSAPKPETAIKEEVGYRYQDDLVLADISFFNINLTNRLLTLNTVMNGNQVSETVNAGGQTSRGVDFQIATRPLLRYFSPYVSFEYLNATIDNDVAALDSAGHQDYLPTNGKTQVMSPKIQAALGLDFDDGAFFSNLRLRFVSSQYSTLMNDEKMPWYITNDVSFGYRFPALSYAKAPKIQLNLVNLTGAMFRTGVYQFQYNANETRGVLGGVIPSSGAPSYYLEPSFAAVLSLSTAF